MGEANHRRIYAYSVGELEVQPTVIGGQYLYLRPPLPSKQEGQGWC